MSAITTTDLAEFGTRERKMLTDLLLAWESQGLPKDFHQEEVRPMLNKNSGLVFLVNSEYEVAAMNGDRLESWFYCGECGNEGFLEDCQLGDNDCNKCRGEGM